VAFVRDGNIWVCNGDGTDPKLIIEDGQSPAWSPDKSQIAFARRGNIWRAMADGSRQRPVTSQWAASDALQFSDVTISWRPSNGSITFSHAEAFRVERTTGAAAIAPDRNAAEGVISGSSIFDVRPAGTEPARATVRYDLFAKGTSFNFADQSHPAWSPSGKKLAFTRNGDIWLVEAESAPAGEPPTGWVARRVAAVARYDEPANRGSRSNRGATRLSWHPDERRLVYGYDRLQGSGFNEVHLLDTQTGKDSTLVKDALEPCVSPDGNFILYRSYGDACGPDGFCVIAASFDGKTRVKILSKATQPVW
jgi:Tol biopolymer transport system component